MSRKIYVATGVLCALAFLLSRQRPPRAEVRAIATAAPQGFLRDVALEQHVRAAVTGAPLRFEENQGQTDPRVKFYARGSSYALFLTPQEADLRLHTPVVHEKRPPQLNEGAQGWADQMAAASMVRLQFVGGNTGAQLKGLEAQPGVINYITGADSKNWQRKVPHYGRVRYEGVYRGIDAVFYGDRRQMEFDFIVAPGADPSAIRMHVAGAGSVELTEEGGLMARTSAGNVTLLPPKLYQQKGGAKSDVEGRFVWRTPDEIGFEVAAYDHSQALVIDPETSVKGVGKHPWPPMRAGHRPKMKSQAPADTPPPTGDSVGLSSYLGGSGDDAIQAISVTQDGNGHTLVYVAGFTDSINTAYYVDFPRVGPGNGNEQSGPGGSIITGCQIPQSPCGDAFVAEFDMTTLTAPVLVSSTYLGGSNDDVAWGMALDANNNPYIVGQTDSADFPTTENAYQNGQNLTYSCGTPAQPRACHHVFFSVLSSDLSQLIYSTYLAGADDDEGYAVALDQDGNAFLTGAAGEYFPAYFFSCDVVFQCFYNGGGDAFYAVIGNPVCPPAASCPNAGVLLYASYLGGYSTDAGLAIAVDSNDNVFVGGVTYSTLDGTFVNPGGDQGPAITSNSLQSNSTDSASCGPGGVFTCGDGFVVEFTNFGASVGYGTFIGGSDADQVNAIELDGFNNLWATGQTRSQDFQPVVDCDNFCGDGFVTLQDFNAGGYDAFLAVFYYGCQTDCSGASDIDYATYLGGGSDDIGLGIALDLSGDAFITGSTTSGPFADPGFPLAQPLQSQTFAGQNYNYPTNTRYPPTSFVSVINAFNSNLVFSTYYGGMYDYYSNTPTDVGTSIALDPNGLIYVGGYTTSFGSLSNTSNSYYGSPSLCLINQVPGANQDEDFSANYNGFVLVINPTNTGAACFSPALVASSLSPDGTPFMPLTFGFPGTLSQAPTQPFPPGPQTLTMFNQGGAALNSTITFTNLVNANAGDFSETDTCTGANTLAGGGTPCQINVSFLPTVSTTGGPVTETATMSIQNSNGNCPTATSCTLTVTGVALPPANPVGFSMGEGSPNFPDTPVGSSSAPQGLFFLDSSTTTYADISQVSLISGNTGDFQIVQDFCTGGQVTANGGSCLIEIVFTPQATGPRSAVLQVMNDGASNPTITLMGNGTTSTNPPTSAISAVSLNFPAEGQGTTSTMQMITLTNTGGTGAANLQVTQPLTFVVLPAGSNQSDFTATGCAAAVAPGANCTITVTFTPKSPDTGALTGMLTINSNATNSPQTVTVSGTSLGPPTAVPSGTVSFPAQVVLTTSPTPIFVTLMNGGGSPLSITSVAPATGNAGDFAVPANLNGCGSTLAAGSSCEVGVTFTPTAAGMRTSQLQFTDSAGNSPQSLPITGTGVAAPTLTPTPTLTFAGTQPLNTPATLTATLTNGNTVPVNILSITATGDFSVPAGPCGASVGANTACPIMVTFTPTAAGARAGTLTVIDSFGGQPLTQTINLSGTGATPATAILSPATTAGTPLGFGTQAIGVTSAAMPVTLTNTGGSQLNISAIAASGDFAETDNCIPTLQGNGASCTIMITFTPSGVGTRNGSIVILDNAAGGSQTIFATGTGSSNVPGFNLSAPLFFGFVLVGSTSPTQIVTITNSGGAPLTITSATATAQFGVPSNNCSTVAIGQNCMIGVNFTPTGNGQQTGTLTIVDNAPGSPHTVALSGDGATVTISPTAGGSTTATVTPGDTAQYPLTVNSTPGLVVTVNLACTSSAPYTQCSISPASVTLGGATSPIVTVTVLTNCNPSLVYRPNGGAPPPILPAPFAALWVGTLALFVLLRKVMPRPWLARVAPVILLLLLVVTWAGCINNPPPALPGLPTTPAGNFAVTVTATNPLTGKVVTNPPLTLVLRVI